MKHLKANITYESVLYEGKRSTPPNSTPETVIRKGLEVLLERNHIVRAIDNGGAKYLASIGVECITPYELTSLTSQMLAFYEEDHSKSR